MLENIKPVNLTMDERCTFAMLCSHGFTRDEQLGLYYYSGHARDAERLPWMAYHTEDEFSDIVCASYDVYQRAAVKADTETLSRFYGEA